MRRLMMIGAGLAMAALSACAEMTLPAALDTTPEAVAALSCSQASDTLAQADAVLDLYAEVEDAVVVAAPVLDALDIDLTAYSRVANIAEVEGVVRLLEDRLALCG